jgi:acetyl-CoA/propionyl-CoA carboxylase carboxyl transferase subunit
MTNETAIGSEAAIVADGRPSIAAAPADQRHELEAELAAEHEREVGGLVRAQEIGVVDEVIEPAKTRQVIAEAIAEAAHARGQHGNIPL